MGEGKQRIISWIVRGESPEFIMRRFNMGPAQFDAFKRNHGNEITYRILKKNG